MASQNCLKILLISLFLSSGYTAKSQYYFYDCWTYIDKTPIDVSGSRNIKIDFSDSTINSDINYVCKNIVSFESLGDFLFKNRLTFVSSKFSTYVELNNCKFLQEIKFLDVEFRNEIGFYSDTFFNTVDFQASKFLGIASFEASNFQTGAQFRNTEFSKTAYFIDVTFSKVCDFSKVKLSDSALLYFSNTLFPDTIDFSYITNMKNDIDLREANFSDTSRYDYVSKKVKPIFINLYKTDIAKIRLDYIHFKLLFQDSIFSNTLSDKKIFFDNEQKEIMYEALLENFKTHGQLESYKLLDIEYQTFKWNNSWAKSFSWLPRLWWNFGYDKQYIFYWMTFFIFVFTFFTYFFIYSLNTKVYRITHVSLNKAWDKKWSFRQFGARLWFSFIYTSMVFFMLTLKVDQIHFDHKRGTAYLLLIHFVGLICIAYLANFIIQK